MESVPESQSVGTAETLPDTFHWIILLFSVMELQSDMNTVKEGGGGGGGGQKAGMKRRHEEEEDDSHNKKLVQLKTDHQSISVIWTDR